MIENVPTVTYPCTVPTKYIYKCFNYNTVPLKNCSQTCRLIENIFWAALLLTVLVTVSSILYDDCVSVWYFYSEQ